MALKLGRNATRAGYRLIAFESIGSTNTEAVARGRAGDAGRLWIVARAQTDGRGRLGRPWQTPDGNLAASVLMRSLDRSENPATLGFAAGLALRQAIAGILPEIETRLRLKWPNDLVFDGAKVAGILLEALSSPEGGNGVAVGFGVNVRAKPRGLPHSTACLADVGTSASAEDVFASLTDCWVDQERLWNAGLGFAAVRERWIAHAAGLQEPIVVRSGERDLAGVFQTIDGEGRLILKLSDGSISRISSAEVHFGALAGAGVARNG